MKNKLKFFMIFGVFFALIISLPQVTQAVMEWDQVNTDGFGNSNVWRSTSMYVFNDQLYVGAGGNSVSFGIWRTNNGTSWSQVSSGGLGDSNNIYADSITVFNNYLYIGTYNTVTGSEIWRSSNGTSWSQVNTDGFGNSDSIRTYSLNVFNNRLYAGVWNQNLKAQVWSTSNGTSWTQVNTNGFGDSDNNSASSMSNFNNQLYVGATNVVNGAQIWRTSNGTTWSRIGTNGLGDSNNISPSYMMTFENQLYVGTMNNISGTQIYRSSNGNSWSQVNTDGFGDSNNTTLYSMSVFDDQLYVGVYNTTDGAQIWRTSNGTSWVQINTDGFGDSNNTIVYSLPIFNNQLYTGTNNAITGTEIWTLSDVSNPTISNQSPADSSTGVDVGANVSFRTDDEDLGVDSDTLDVTIEGDEAITDGSCQSGYSCSITAYGDNGYNVSINPSANFDYSREINVEVNIADLDGDNTASSSWSFTTEVEQDSDNNNDNQDTSPTLSPIILTTSGPGQPTRLQAYSKGNTNGANSLLENDITDLFPSSYTGGAGIVPIDQSNNSVLDQFLIFAISNGGPQARVMGLRSNGTTILKGQQFVFQNPTDASGTSSIRDGLSMTTGDFDNDGYKDDAAACLTGNYKPHVKIYTDVSGIDNWNLLNQFTIPNVGPTGCNLGTFQYDTGAEELLITPNHGPATPNVYIYTVGGTQKEVFQAYDDPIDQGLTATGISDRIYTTPNNGSSQVNAFNKAGERKNFWWVYDNHVRGDFTIRSAQLDPSTTKQELLISPIGSNGPHILGYQASGIQKPSPNFFAFNDPTLRNGVGIAVIENFHGVN